MPHAKWATAPAFAEVAEALQIRTDQIVGTKEDDRGIVVLFTRDEGDEPPVFAVGCQRDLDGIMRARSARVAVPHFWSDFKRRLDEAGL
jgi:hypothetical protein